MDATTPLSPSTPSVTDDASLSPFQRMIAVFVRPTRAWIGLQNHAQWWFPLILTLAISAGVSATLHDRAFVPMMQDRFEEQVANGQMTGEQADRMLQTMTNRVWTLVPQLVVIPLMTLLFALIIWFGVGFILGQRFPYRLALEVACWSALVNIPAQILFFVIAWSKQTMRDIHVGFGLLLPETETPSKLLSALGGVLDAFGPFSIWYLIVVILGASALSGAPRKSTAWVLGGLYVALVLLVGAIGALVGPGS